MAGQGRAGPDGGQQTRRKRDANWTSSPGARRRLAKRTERLEARLRKKSALVLVRGWCHPSPHPPAQQPRPCCFLPFFTLNPPPSTLHPAALVRRPSPSPIAYLALSPCLHTLRPSHIARPCCPLAVPRADCPDSLPRCCTDPLIHSSYGPDRPDRPARLARAACLLPPASCCCVRAAL